MTVTELAIKRPILVIVFFLSLALLGTFGYFQLRYELLPKVEPPFVIISTTYPGASPSEIETGVTKPIEDAVSSSEKLSNIYANSYEGVSVISLEFNYSADADKSMQNVQRKINGLLMSLPKGARTPVVQKWSLDELPVLQMGVSSNMPLRDFTQFLKDEIQPAFSKIDGVGQVKLIGGDTREIKVNLDAQKVRARNLSISQVTQIIKASNIDFPTGTIKGAETEAVVRISGKFNSIDEFRNLVIARSSEGGDVRLGDIAEIEDGRQDYTTYSRINGKSTVGIRILKQTDANAVEVSKKVRAEINDLEARYRHENVRFDIVSDGSLFTIEAADAVKKDLLVAVLLVSAVMFLFLHSVRSSIIILIAIPASLLAAVLTMWMLNFSLNLMTLLALSLVIGILVDDSIVVLENIQHHLEQGEDKRTAALRGRNEIGFAALSITLVDVVVFVPLTLIVGLVGDIMREFSIVIVVSTLMSLVVSFTLTPMLASRFSQLERVSGRTVLGQIAVGFERIWKRAIASYSRLLSWSLNHQGRVIAGVTALFIIALGLPAMGLVGSEFMKETDRGEFIVQIEMAPSASLEYTNRITQRVERILAGIPEIKRIQSLVGSGAQGMTASNISGIYVLLTDRGQRRRSTDAIATEIKSKTRQIPGAKVFIDQISITGEQYGVGFQVMVRGTNPDSLQAMVREVAAAMRRTPSVIDVKYSSEQGKPEVKIEIDRQKMATFGLTVYDIGTTLRVALTGDDESTYREGQNEHAIHILLDKFDRSNPDDVARLSFITPTGHQVELQQFAEIYPASGPTKLERFNRSASVTMTGYVDGSIPVGNVSSTFMETLGSHRVNGTSVSFIGNEKDRAESFGQMGIALLASIIFVYFIMVGLYNSFVYPFVVLFSVPLALIGALVALAITGNALSIFSILGMIMMVGLVAKNAILLVDRTNDNRGRGLTVHEALMEAGQARSRPIVMTTLSMVFGMLPIAIASGAGAEWKNGLAWSLIGGLTSSMFLTLIVVPIVYTKVDNARRLVPVLFQRPDSIRFIRQTKAVLSGLRRSRAGNAPTMMLLLTLLWGAANASYGGAKNNGFADRTSLRIAVVADGPWERNQDYFTQLQSVLKEVLGDRVDLQYVDSKIIEGDWTLPGVRAVDNRLLADPQVDLVIGLGVIVSHDLATRGPLSKPVIAPFILDPIRQSVPLTNGASGVRNLSYMIFPMTFKEDVELFRTIVPFTKLVCITSKRYLQALPLPRTRLEEIAATEGIDVTVLPIDSSADEVLSRIPADAGGVYVEPVLHLRASEFQKLVEGFKEKSLPSFSLYGESEVRQGIMAGANPDILPRLLRRIALHVQRISHGERPETFAVTFPAARRLYFNFQTASRVRATPNWDLLLESEMMEGNVPSPFSEHYTMPSAIKRMMESNTDLLAKNAEVDADAENVRIARANMLPRLDLNAAGYQIDADRALAGLQPQRSASAELSASQVLFSEPAIANVSIQSSLYDVRLSELKQTQLNTVVSGATAYINLLRAHKMFTILLDNLKITRSNLEAAEVRRSTGAAGEEEVLRWKMEIAEMKKAVMSLHSQMNQARYLLNQHLNMQLGTELELTDLSLDDSTFLIANPKIVSYLSNPQAFNLLMEYFIADGYKYSPEIQQLDAAISAQERALTSTRFSYFTPTVTAFGRFGSNFYKSDQPSLFQVGALPPVPEGLDPKVPQYIGQLFSAASPAAPDRNDWTIGLQVSFNLFNGLSTRATEVKTSQQVEQYKLQRQAVSEKVALRIRSDMQSAKASYFAIGQSRAEQEAAHRVLKLVTDAYTRGAVSILSVLDAQNSALRADQVATNAMYDFFIQYLEMQRSLGRFDLLMSAKERDEYLRECIDRMEYSLKR